MITSYVSNRNTTRTNIACIKNVRTVISCAGIGQSSCRITRDESGDLVVVLCHGRIRTSVIDLADIASSSQRDRRCSDVGISARLATTAPSEVSSL